MYVVCGNCDHLSFGSVLLKINHDDKKDMKHNKIEISINKLRINRRKK